MVSSGKETQLNKRIAQGVISRWKEKTKRVQKVNGRSSREKEITYRKNTDPHVFL